MATKKTPKKTPDFEKSLNELERLVESMEQGELSLEESLKSFERGMALSSHCQQALAGARQRVDQVLEKDGEAQLSPLDEGEGSTTNADEDELPF